MAKVKISDNMKNVARISTGTAMGQIISIITLPIITRIYGPEIMGIWATIIAISGIVSTISDLGLTQSIMVEKDDEIENTYQVICFLNILICFIAFFVILIYGKLILRQSIETMLIISVFSLIYSITSQQVAINYTLLNRNENYSVLMKNPVINQIVIAVFSIDLGLVGAKKIGYFVGVVMGQIITLLHMKRHIRYKVKFTGVHKIKNTCMQNIDFIKFQMPGNIMYQLRMNVPTLLIGGLFGNTILGYYSISVKLLNIPINFIGQSLGKVFYQRLAVLKQKGNDVSNFVYRNLSRATKLAFVPMTLLAAFGDAAVVLFFGADYSVGGTIVRIVVFKALFDFLAASVKGLDIVLKKQSYALITGIAHLVFASLSVIVSFSLTGDIIVCAFFMTATNIIVQISYYSAMMRVMKTSVTRYVIMAISTLVMSMILSVIIRTAFMWFADFTQWRFLKYLYGFLVK